MNTWYLDYTLIYSWGKKVQTVTDRFVGDTYENNSSPSLSTPFPAPSVEGHQVLESIHVLLLAAPDSEVFSIQLKVSLVQAPPQLNLTA